MEDYPATWRAMRRFNAGRDADTADEIWLLQHAPVYTLGLRCKQAPQKRDRRIPVIFSDRGGQMTYHGPGQLVAYVLMDLRRRAWGVRDLVGTLEGAVIALLNEQGIDRRRREGAPGVYVDGRKIAALGLRVRHGCSYHGLSLNVDMDLAPLRGIDPCGIAGLGVTQLADGGFRGGVPAAADALLPHLCSALKYTVRHAA